MPHKKAVGKKKPGRHSFSSIVMSVVLLGTVLLAGTAAGLELNAEGGAGLQAQTFIEDFENLIKSWGAWGVFAAIGLMIVHSFIPFPAEFVAIANGMVYGSIWGTVITWTGAMLGAFLSFGLTRILGRPFVDKMLSNRRWQEVDDWLVDHGGRTLLLSRFIPVISFNIINYAAGLTRISWWTFAWATGLGILPLTTIMVVMGDQMDSLPWYAWVLLGGAGLALWLIAQRLSKPSAGSE